MKRINQVPNEVTFPQAIKDFFAGYVEFKGRSTRAGFWWVKLVTSAVNFIFLSIAIGIIFNATFGLVDFVDYEYYPIEEMGIDLFRALSSYISFFLIYGAIFLGLLLPNFALTCRRLRDVGLRGRGIIMNYLILGGFILLNRVFQAVDHTSYGTSVYSFFELLCSSITLVISVQMIVFCILPTDELMTSSNNRFMRFFFREKAQIAPNLNADVMAE